MIKAVIFDMNGVIINDEHVHELAFQETVKPFGITLDHQAYLECCAGKTDKAGYESIAEKYHVSLPIDKLLAEKGNQYLQLFPSHKQTYPHVIELIRNVSSTFTLAVTSSSSRKEVDLILKEFGIIDLFKITISGDDVVNGKPDPEPYVKTAKQLNVNTNECVVVEDSKSGVLSAKAAGTYCIGVTTTHTKEELSNADLIIESFDHITTEVIGNMALS